MGPGLRRGDAEVGFAACNTTVTTTAFTGMTARGLAVLTTTTVTPTQVGAGLPVKAKTQTGRDVVPARAI